RGAGQPGALAVLIIAMVLAGLCALFFAYLVVEQPTWRIRRDSPWTWMVITNLPMVARTVLIGVAALVGAGQVARAR
ncbi:MAG TPA: hypothetical protein VL172_18655, partial [Kofleriaceae bacterium]|nr:hypothetical protein [Kofleriaceae bacterium]